MNKNYNIFFKSVLYFYHRSVVILFMQHTFFYIKLIQLMSEFYITIIKYLRSEQNICQRQDIDVQITCHCSQISLKAGPGLQLCKCLNMQCIQ